MIKTRLVQLLSHSKKYIALTVLWQWMALLTQIGIIFVLARGLSQALDQGVLPDKAALMAGLIMAGVALRFICDKMATRMSYAASMDAKEILREKMLRKLLALGSGYTKMVSTSEVVQLATEGVEQLEIYFGKYLPQLFYSLLAPVTLFVVLSTQSVKASGVLLLCVPLIPLSIVGVARFAKKRLGRYWESYAKLGDSFLENLTGLTTLKIYQADERRADAMDVESQHFRRVTMKVLTMQVNSTSIMDIVAYGGAVAGMVVAGYQYLAGNLTMAGALTIILLASEFFLPLRLLGSYFHIAMNGMAASDKIFRLLDLPEPSRGRITLGTQGNDLVMEGLRFSYGEDQGVLDNVNLRIPAKSFVALVGVSGCGKSTILRLLTGGAIPQEGAVSIGGIPLGDVEEASLKKAVTMVTHNAHLFKGSVRYNLTMAKANARDGELIAQLKKVNLWAYLSGQQGLDTPILESGSNLSGGQCQRLALARALLKDSPIYLFDEATSNIDVESEGLIMEVIEGLAATKTVVVISHRLANVVGADCIHMMACGRIVERGTHGELMAAKAKGPYEKLYNQQEALENDGLKGGVR